MCCCGSKCTIIYTAIYTLVQSLVWTVFGFLGIALYNCGFEIDPVNPVYYLYFVYFFNRDCAAIPNILNITAQFCDYVYDQTQHTCEEYNNFNQNFTLPPGVTYPSEWVSTIPSIPDWPNTFQPSEETHTFMIVYVVLSLVWAASAIILLVSGVLSIRRIFMFIPWILVTIAILVFDIYVTATYASHAIDAQTAVGLLNLIGVGEIPSFQNYDPKELLSKADGISMVPSVVMAVVGARGAIFWLKNLSMLIGMFFVACTFTKKKNEELPRYPNHVRNAAANEDDKASSLDGTRDVHDGFQRNTNVMQQPGLYQPTTYANQMESAQLPRVSHVEYDSEGYLKRRVLDSQQHEGYPPPFSYTNGLPVSPKNKSVVPNPRPPSDPDYIEPEHPPVPWFHNPNQMRRKDTPMVPQEPWRKDTPMVPQEPWRKDTPMVPQEPWRKDTPMVPQEPWRKDTPMVPQEPWRKDTPMVPQEPWRKPVERIESQRSNISMQPPDELRSQLPWSYYQPRNAPVKPKLKPTQERSQEDMPPVPVPDYTMHFGKTPRPSATWSESSSTPSQGKTH